MQFTIDLPDTLATTLRSGASDTLDIAKLSPEVIARAVLLGLGTKHRNFAASALMNCRIRAAGAKRNDETDDAYAKRIEKITVASEDLNAEALACMVAGRKRLEAGEWGAERGASAGPDLDVALIDWAAMTYRAKLVADIAGLADMKATARREAVNAWLDAKAGRREAVAAKMAEARAVAMDI